MDATQRNAAWVRSHIERGATVIIALHWDETSKLWRIVASHHGTNRVRVHTGRIHTTAAIDVDELKLLSTAIQRECESWLF